MATLDSIIRVSVSRQTRPVPQTGFGVPLLLSFRNTKPAGVTGDYLVVNSTDDYTSSLAGDTLAIGFLTRLFSQSLTIPKCVVAYKESADTNVTNSLDRIKEAIDSSADDFYAVCPVGGTVAEWVLVARWAAGNTKLAIIQDTDDASLESGTTSDIGSLLESDGNDRAAVFWTGNETDHIHAAIVGRCFPAAPGSVTWAYKSLVGVPVSSDVTTTAAGVLTGKNVNFYTRVGGVNIIRPGKTSGGEFIDIVRSIDWLTARIQENVFFYLSTADKVPYTDAGADILVGGATEILDQATTRNVITTDYTVRKPSVASIPINDRANRNFPDINVRATLVNAIHMANYNLTITV